MKYTHEQQEEALYRASRTCGLDAHIYRAERKSDLTTWADKMAGRFFRKMMPIKRSYLYCDSLDVDFFFSEDGRAEFTYAGICSTEKEATNMREAFMLADKMRQEMQKEIDHIEEAADGIERR